VADEQQAVMAGVKVTATNAGTGASQSSVTSSAGVYSIPALQPGEYKLVAEMAGFKKLTRQGIRVETSATLSLDLLMEVGATTAEVTVTADIPLVQQANSTVQYTINQKQLAELPLNDASALHVMSLLPGVVGDPGSEQASVTTGLVTPGGGMSVSGGRMGSTNYQADGVSNNSMYLGRISLSFSSDSLAEVSVQQNAFSAEYGRVGGGIVNMTTKSGSNQIRGTVFSNSRNNVFDAAPYRNTFEKKGVVRYWRGGFNVGGPVVIPKIYNGRNRTFFFTTFEPLRRYTQSSGFARVATEAEREGDFSKSVYNTATNQRIFLFRQFEFNDNGLALTNQRIIPAAGQAYPQWENNVIPKRFISPIGQRVLKMQPLPNMPLNELGQNYTVFRNVRNTDNRFLVKFDQIVTNSNRMSVRVAYVPVKGERYFMGGLQEQVPTDTSLGTNAAFSDTQTWGGNKVNELRLGYNRSVIERRQKDEQLAANYYQEYGFPSKMDKGFPQLGVGDSQVQAWSANPGDNEIDNHYQLLDVFNWTKGKHSIKTGFEVQLPQQNLISYGNVGGNWSFNSGMTNIGSGNTGTAVGIANAQTGLGMASLLLGYPNSVAMAPAVIPYQYRWKYFAGFFQDDFKVSRSLTLNLGVRYQVEIPRSEKHNNQGYFVPDTITTASGAQQVGYVQLNGLGGARKGLWDTRYDNFEPRIGFAWRVPSFIKGLSVVRGAYAISHIPTNGLFRIPIPDLAPRASAAAASGAANGAWVQMDTNPLLLPSGATSWPADGKLTDLTNISAVYYLPEKVTIPYMQQWNFGLGFQFGRNYGLEVNYVGSKGTNLFGPSQLYNGIDLAQYTTQFIAGLNMAERLPNPGGLKDQNGNVITVARQDLLRPQPILGSVTNPLAQGYNSVYNSLQMNLVRRFSNGFQFQVNYTWMKSIDTSSCEGQFCNDNIQNWGTGFPQLRSGDRKLERSISVFSIPHVFRFNYNWTLPFGRKHMLAGNAPGWLNQVIGDWKISGSGGLRTGSPLQAGIGNNAGFPEDVGRIRPNVVSGVSPYVEGWRNNLNNISQRTAYVNVLKAFTLPERLTVGNAPRVFDYIRMPATGSYDMSVMKDIVVTDRVRMQLRAELYGALNHPFPGTNGNNFVAYQNLNYQATANPVATAATVSPSYADIGANIAGRRNIQLSLRLSF